MALVAHGWAAPAAVDPEREPAPEPAARLVEGLAALPGAEYVLAVDAGGDRVRGESGGPPGPAMAVIDWARRVAEISRERDHDLEDLVLTTDAAFHLVRLVTAHSRDPRAEGPEGPLWVTVRIDRARGNLAWSRRALAGLGTPVSVPGPREIGPGPQSSAPHSSAPQSPALESSAPLRPSTPVEPFAPAWSRPAAAFGPAAPEGSVPASRSPWPSTSSWPAAPAAAASSSMPAPSRPSSPPPPAEPTAREVVGRSWFSPAAAPEPSPVEGRRSWATRRPAPESTSSWFSASTAASPWPSRGSDPAASPDDPTVVGPPSGAFPAAMPAPAGPGPRGDEAPADRGPDAGTDLPRRERGATFPGTRRVGSLPTERTTGPANGPSSRRLPLTVREGVWWSGRPERPDMPELGPPTGPTPVVSAAGVVEPAVPAARTSAEDPPAPAVPAPRVPGSLFAPVVVVPPPPSPVPEDDTTEMPAPAPYPTITAAPVEAPEAPEEPAEPTEEAAEEPADGTVEETAPADATDDATEAGEAADELPDLPRRRPGSHLPAGMPATPRSVPTVRPRAAVAGAAAFTTEPSVLRRLIDGLRRLS